MWSLIAAISVLSALASLPLVAPRSGTAPPRRVAPFALAFAVVCLLLYLNQVAFQVYVYEEHGGNTAFIGRTFPALFFDRMAPAHPPVRWLRQALNGADFLAPSVMRVQAVLELPFALLAYLGVARLLDRAVARQIAAGPLGVLACVSYSVVLSAIEVLLWNRFTVDDLWLRGLACALTIPLLRLLAGPAVPHDAPSIPRLLRLVLGLGGMALVVVVVNLVALLYNLGWLPSLAGPLALGAALFAWAAWEPRHAPQASRDRLVLALFAVGRRFTMLFAAPALAIRYGASHPVSRPWAGVAMVVVTLAAVILGLRDAWRDLPPERRLGWPFCVAAALLGASLAPLLDLAALLRLPLLAISDAWFLQKAGLVLGGFVAGWGAAALSLRGRPVGA